MIKNRYSLGSVVALMAALLSWSLVEILFKYSSFFTDFRTVFLLEGVIIGGTIGLFITALEGILQKNSYKLFKEVCLGFIFGSFGGILGLFISQQFALILLPAEIFPEKINLYFRLARGVSWIVIGLFIGSAEGLRTRSKIKLKVGLISGSLGGLFGGVILESLSFLSQGGIVLFLGILSLSLGLCLFSLYFEVKFSPGLLRLLNGKSKGLMFQINQRSLTLGFTRNCDIFLPPYNDLLHDQTLLKLQGRGVLISGNSQLLKVNDKPCKEGLLKYGDVIEIGEYKFIFEVGR